MGLTNDEWTTIYLTRKSGITGLAETVDETMESSNAVDWRDKGAV